MKISEFHKIFPDEEIEIFKKHKIKESTYLVKFLDDQEALLKFSEEIGMGAGRLSIWASCAELCTIERIGPQLAILLCDAGIIRIEILAGFSPYKLRELVRYMCGSDRQRYERAYLRVTPSLKTLDKIVKRAKKRVHERCPIIECPPMRW